MADTGPCKRSSPTGEGTETLAYGKAVSAIRDQASALQTPGLPFADIGAVRSKRCDDRVVRGQIRRSASADHPTGDMTERDLSYPWPRVPQETETSNRRHRPVQHRAGSKARGAPMPSRPPQPRRSPQMPAELRCTFLPNRSGTAGVLALCSQLVDCVSPRQRSDQTMRPPSSQGAKCTVTFID